MSRAGGRSVLGASLLAAAASLPLHLMPLLVAAVVADGRLPVAQAGWLASAYLLGLLAVVTGLPALRLRALGPGAAALAAVVLLGALALSRGLPGTGLLLAWLAVGGSCGALQFLSTTAAAAAADRQRAFALRLAVVLLAGSAALLALRVWAGLASYGSVAAAMLGVFALLLAAGLLLYRRPAAAASAPAANPEAGTARAARAAPVVLALSVLALLFAGQTGFMAYAARIAQQHGLALENLAYAMAACKGLAALVLFRTTGGPARQARPALLRPGLAVVAGVVLMASAANTPQFFAGMLLWELGLNPLSVRLQAEVVRTDPAAAGPWLAAALYLGAATGPALHGAALQLGLGLAFTALACLSALVPAWWLRQRHGRVAFAQAGE